MGKRETAKMAANTGSGRSAPSPRHCSSLLHPRPLGSQAWGDATRAVCGLRCSWWTASSRDCSSAPLTRRPPCSAPSGRAQGCTSTPSVPPLLMLGLTNSSATYVVSDAGHDCGLCSRWGGPAGGRVPSLPPRRACYVSPTAVREKPSTPWDRQSSRCKNFTARKKTQGLLTLTTVLLAL